MTRPCWTHSQFCFPWRFRPTTPEQMRHGRRQCDKAAEIIRPRPEEFSPLLRLAKGQFRLLCGTYLEDRLSSSSKPKTTTRTECDDCEPRNDGDLRFPQHPRDRRRTTGCASRSFARNE